VDAVNSDVADGNVSDGDDHVWLGDVAKLADGGWRKLARIIHLKRRMRVDDDDDDGGGGLLSRGTAPMGMGMGMVDKDEDERGEQDAESEGGG